MYVETADPESEYWSERIILQGEEEVAVAAEATSLAIIHRLGSTAQASELSPLRRIFAKIHAPKDRFLHRLQDVHPQLVWGLSHPDHVDFDIAEFNKTATVFGKSPLRPQESPVIAVQHPPHAADTLGKAIIAYAEGRFDRGPLTPLVCDIDERQIAKKQTALILSRQLKISTMS